MIKTVRILRTGILCCFLFGGLTALTHVGRAVELKAGVARVDLTPPLELMAPLGGYGERMNRPAEGVHDRIFAKALVLAQEKKRFALVTVDIVGFPPTLKPELLERLGDGWAADQLMLLASHSHTSIEMNAINPLNTFQVPQLGIYNVRVHQFVVDHLLEVIHQAEKQLVAVKVGTTTAAIEGRNRIGATER